jgi:exodeoxyribonuclease V alpha subunit
MAWLNHPLPEDVAIMSWEADGGYTAAIELAVSYYSAYFADLTLAPERLLALFNQYRVLCALRQGDHGVEGLNIAIEAALMRRGLVSQDGESEWYEGRPILITANNHGLGLYNGDVGICLYRDQQWRIWFETGQGQVRSVLPTRLPAHMTVYAMTIHKSQGSEFAYTVLILPPQPHPVVTRELVYTGITRAKQHLALYTSFSVLLGAVSKPTVRYSGLRTRLLS